MGAYCLNYGICEEHDPHLDHVAKELLKDFPLDALLRHYDQIGAGPLGKEILDRAIQLGRERERAELDAMVQADAVPEPTRDTLGHRPAPGITGPSARGLRHLRDLPTVSGRPRPQGHIPSPEREANETWTGQDEPHVIDNESWQRLRGATAGRPAMDEAPGIDAPYERPPIDDIDRDIGGGFTAC